MFKISKDGLAYKPFKEDKDDVVKELPSGIYKLIPLIGLFGNSFYFEKYNQLERYIEPTKSESYQKIKSLVSKTFNTKLNALYKDLGYINKTGIIMYGKPGTGKTAQALCLANNICKKFNAICLFVPSKDSFSMICAAIEFLQEVEPNRPVLWIIDEMETIIQGYPNDTQSVLVSILDGYKSMNNTCFIGITNYYNKISDKFKNRPSRIKLAEEITSVPYEVIKELILNKVPEKYLHLLDVDKLAFEYSESKRTIDMVKQEILCKLEDIVISEKDIEIKEETRTIN